MAVSDAAITFFHEVAAAAPGLPREEALTASLEHEGLAFFRDGGLAPVVTLSDMDGKIIWKAPGE